MLIFGIFFVVAYLFDSTIFPGFINNYYGYLVTILFVSSLLVVKNHKSLVYALIVLGLIYEILGGYTFGAYLLPLLAVCLLVVSADYYVNIRTFFIERGLLKYFLAPFVIIICLVAMQYLELVINRLISSRYDITRLVQLEDPFFLIYLYCLSFVVFWIYHIILDKYETRIQGNN